MDAFTWVPSDNPRIIGETRIQATWTLDVQPDGSVIPRLPDRIILRDGPNLRPVAPFIELWCAVGDANDPDNWVHQPLTTRLLQAEGLNGANLTFTVTAMNLKAARRTGNRRHGFGTFTPVEMRGDNHTPQRLRAESPPALGANEVPMIPRGRFIPMGNIQVMRPGVQPPNGTTAWDAAVNLETIRLRYTPAIGTFYGPPEIANLPLPENSAGPTFTAIPEENAFLNAAAGWYGAAVVRGPVSPGDTYDGAERDNRESFGVVDDTCEVRIGVQLDQTSVGQGLLDAEATVWSSPPDYAPDRRPFISLADSINDRAGDRAVRNAAMTTADQEQWVEDLFERTFETLSLMNVDYWRSRRGSQLRAEQLNDTPIPGDQYPQPTRAMGGQDHLRNPDIAITAPSENLPLPMSDRAKERHRDLADIAAIKAFVLENPERLQRLIRPPFSVDPVEDETTTTMQMPPFMRNSNARPLTLTPWQYELLMAWQAQVQAQVQVTGAVTLQPQLSPRAIARRAAILQTLDQATRQGEGT